MNAPEIAHLVINEISAMVAYWGRDEICRYANRAYMEWFGRTPEEMSRISLRELLGPLYELNLPQIQGVLAGKRQVLERQLRLPTGQVREVLASYDPHFVDGVVLGFSVYATDIGPLRQRERKLEAALGERESASQPGRPLPGLLPICSCCKSIRDDESCWHSFEEYVSQRTSVRFTHGLCPSCLSAF